MVDYFPQWYFIWIYKYMYLNIDKSNGKNFIPVINLLFVVDPKTSQFGKNIDDLEGFQVINVNIWHPEIMNKLQIDWKIRMWRQILNASKFRMQLFFFCSRYQNFYMINNNVISVVEFQRWWALKHKIFAPKSTSSSSVR